MFRRAIEKLEQLSADPVTRKAYERSINEQRNQVAVLGFEREEGRKEQSLEIARKMLKRNRPIQEISEDNGLSIKEIEALRSEEFLPK